MLHFILTWLGAAIALIVTARFVPGFQVDSFTAALIGAAIMGLVNAIVRPILILLTLPLTIVTLGLFLLVINAIAFWLVVVFTPGLHITGFFAALVASVVLTIVSTVISFFLRIFD